MGVPAHDGVNAAHPTCHFQIHIHTVMGKNHDNLGPFSARLCHHFLHVFVLNSKCPISNHVAGVSDRRVRECLTNDGARYAVDFSNHIGFENWITKVIGLDVLGNKVDLASKIFIYDFFDTFHPIGKLPMAGHDVYAQKLAGINHVLTVGPK